jgi:phosphatidylethanolamine/phosphatidyl-N-methylethanolamine N-methyltransferase
VKKTSFLKEFLTRKNQVGAVAPSSKYLTKKMLGGLELVNADVVIELGPGTGVFTERLLELIGPKTTLLVIEINETFYENLKTQIKDPRAIIVKGSATDLDLYLKQIDKKEADIIISSLPLAVLPKTLRNRIVFSAKNILKTGGLYVQFQYSLHSIRILKRVFNSVKIKHCTLNIPPAFVYTCTKK